MFMDLTKPCLMLLNRKRILIQQSSCLRLFENSRRQWSPLHYRQRSGSLSQCLKSIAMSKYGRIPDKKIQKRALEVLKYDFSC